MRKLTIMAAVLAVGVSGSAEAAAGGNFAESLSGQSVSGMVGSLSGSDGASAIATGIGADATQTSLSPTTITSLSSSHGQFSVGTRRHGQQRGASDEQLRREHGRRLDHQRPVRFSERERILSNPQRLGGAPEALPLT